MWYAGKFDEACWQLLAMLGFMNARFSRGIWLSGVGHQDSRNCYLIYVSMGTKKGLYHFVLVKRSGTAAGTTRWCTDSSISPSRKPS